MRRQSVPGYIIMISSLEARLARAQKNNVTVSFSRFLRYDIYFVEQFL